MNCLIVSLHPGVTWQDMLCLSKLSLMTSTFSSDMSLWIKTNIKI